MIDPEPLSRHIGEIYDASVDPARWPATIEASARLLNSCAGVIASIDVMLPIGNVIYSSGYDPAYLKFFADDFSRYPLIRVLMRSRVGYIGSAVGAMTEQGFRRSVLYQEWSDPKGYVVDAFNVTLERTATAVVHLGFVRHESVGILDDEARHDLGLLFPHYRRATLIGRVLEHTRVQAALLADTLDGLAAAVFLVDAEMRPVHVNRAGARMLQEGAAVQRRGASLAFSKAAADRSLRRACEAIAGGRPPGNDGLAVAVLGRDGEPHVAHVLPLTSGARREAGRSYRAVAAVFVRSARLERPPALEAMAQLYGLTPAEIKTLVGVVELGGIPAVARAHEVSPETVKTHLKRTFEKTGTSRQADLAKLMAGIVSPLARKRDAALPRAAPSCRQGVTD